jgi:uncharacterized protein (TIGR02001 family)
MQQAETPISTSVSASMHLGLRTDMFDSTAPPPFFSDDDDPFGWRAETVASTLADAGCAEAKAGAALIPAADSMGPPETSAHAYAFSGDIVLVSDYRIAGVSSTGRSAALQGEVDIDMPSGWSAGVWASNIKEYAGSHFEVDLYASRSFTLGATEYALGATAIVLPGGDNISVGLATASASRPIGPVDATLALRYAWPQSILDGDHDLYVSLNGKSPIGRLNGVPLTLGAGMGYEEGAFAVASTKIDWTLSIAANIGGVDFGLAYVDTNVDDPAAAAGCIFSITRSF